jgi:hypothetical protein
MSYGLDGLKRWPVLALQTYVVERTLRNVIHFLGTGSPYAKPSEAW